MPFFEDIGVKTEEQRGPFWSAFALIADQIERIVALNLGWAAQLLPALIALAFDVIPFWLRILLIIYSVIAIGPATGVLYVMITKAARGEMLRFDDAKEAVRQNVLPSLTRLMPLYSLFAWISFFDYGATVLHITFLSVLFRLSLMLLAVFSIYWGPIYGRDPQQAAWKTFKESVRLVWKRPGLTIGMGIVILLLWLLGVVSVGGLFLIAPTAASMVQTRLLFHIARKESRPA